MVLRCPNFMEMALALASDELHRSGLHFYKEKIQGYLLTFHLDSCSPL